MEGNVNSEEKRPSSPVIPENGISWRIQSPPNRRADDLDGSGNFANNNGKGIKEEDSILVDDPVTPWREDVYEDLINSINKPNIARVLETSASQKVGQKRNMQRNKKKGISSTQPKNLGKGRKKVPQQNAVPNLGNSTTKVGDFKITQPTTTPIGSPPRDIQQPNPTSNVNLSPKITETLQDESPTSSMPRRRGRRSPIPACESDEAKVGIKPKSKSPSPKKNRVLGRQTGGIDAEHPGIVISSKNNMGTRNRKKNLEKQPSKLESSYVKNNVNSSQSIPILEWYGDNVVNGYDLAIPSDSLAVSKEAFLMQDSSINAAASSVKSLSPPPNSVQNEISSAYRRLSVTRESPKLFSHMRMASASALELEHDNVRTDSKKKSTNSDGLEMTPNVVKPPFMHDRGQKGPLYFQTSATYDALIVEKNDDSHSNRPRTTPNRHRVAMSGRKDSSARESIQDKAKILNILYDPKLDMSRTAPLPSHLAEHKIKLDLEKQQKRRRPRTMEGYRRKHVERRTSGHEAGTVIGGSGYLPSMTDAEKRKLLRKQMGLPVERTANAVDEADFENEYKSWALEFSMPSTATLSSDEDEGDHTDSKHSEEGKYDGTNTDEERSSYVPKNSRIPYYALLRQRNPFHVDKTGADGGGVPIGFSDRRHKMALARKRVTDEEFMFAVKQRRKEKRKEIKRRRKYLLKLNAQNKRKMGGNIMGKQKHNADKVGSVGQRIALNSFIDSSGAEIMMFAMPPPLPPGAPPWPWEPGASDFDGTSTLEPSSKSSSDMALGRAREAAKDGEDLASELHGIDLSDSSEPDTPPEPMETGRSSVPSEDEDPPPPCYPARRWEKMTPELQMLEAEISCWESDVRDACTVDDVDYALPEDFVRESKKNGVEGGDSVEDSDDGDDEAEKKRKARESSERLADYIEWFSKNDKIRASFMDQEIQGAIMHVPIQSAAAIEGIDIDLLRNFEEERRDAGSTDRLHLRDKWESAQDDDEIISTEEEYHEDLEKENLEKSLLELAEGLEVESKERRTFRALRAFVKWYRKHKYLRREFLNHRNTLLKRAVDKLVRWGRNRTVITLDAFGPMVDELTIGGDIGVPWDDLNESEKEMEIMSALCDKHVRSRAEHEGIPLPPVFGVIDGTGLDTEEEIEFAKWFATAEGVRFDFFMREMEAAMKNNEILASAAENEIIKDDAETMDVVVPTTITDKQGNIAIKSELEENVEIIIENESSLEHNGDPKTVKEEFKEWLTSEDDVIPYTVEVKDKVFEEGDDEGLSVKISIIEEGSEEETAGEADKSSATAATGIDKANLRGGQGPSATVTTETQEDEQGDSVLNESATEASAAEQKDSIAVGSAQAVANLPARDRRGAPLGKRRTFQEFKSWYINDHESRKRFLDNRRSLFRNALKQRARSKSGFEIPDIWADDLALENYEDDIELQEAQDYADEKSWYIDRWEVLGWYSNKKLEEDDAIMRSMEHKARRKLDRDKRKAFNARVEGLLKVGMDEFDGDYVINENVGGFVQKVPDYFQLPDGWDNGSGLLNNDEAYFAMKEKEEAEREFIRQEKLREKRENEEMEKEEKQRRAYLFYLQLEELQSSKKKAVLDEVLRLRRLTLERYYDPYGRTLAEKEEEEKREAHEEELRLRRENILRQEKENTHQMAEEDKLAFEIRAEYLKEVEAIRRREISRREKQIMAREIKAMEFEDDLAMQIIEEEERVLAEEAHQARLRAIMNVKWKPAMNADEDPVLFKPYGLEDKRIFNVPYFPQVSRIERVLPPVQTGPKRFIRSRGSSRPSISRGSARSSLSRPNSRQERSIDRNKSIANEKRPNTSPVRARPHSLMALQRQKNQPKDLSPLVADHQSGKSTDSKIDTSISHEDYSVAKTKNIPRSRSVKGARRRMVADSNAIESHRNRPSTTPSKSRRSIWQTPASEQMPHQSGFPEIRLRKEPRLGALGIKKKIVQKNSSSRNADGNILNAALQRADGGIQGAQINRWGGEIKRW